MNYTSTFVFHPHLAGLPHALPQLEELRTQFCYGYSFMPISIPVDLSTPLGVHFRHLVRLTPAEVAERLIARLKEKAADMAAADPIIRSSTMIGLTRVLAGNPPALLALTGVRDAIEATIAAANRAAVQPPEAPIIERSSAWGVRGEVATLQQQIAALTARLAELEASGRASP